MIRDNDKIKDDDKIRDDDNELAPHLLSPAFRAALRAGKSGYFPGSFPSVLDGQIG